MKKLVRLVKLVKLTRTESEAPTSREAFQKSAQSKQRPEETFSTTFLFELQLASLKLKVGAQGR